ncbi:hypothetical protein [Terracoccus sp. 273MFTsu3.1]|uniref:hypothetical protein n=1 Tax=Terracoccus sp. 273MFTsu3.1 TaxID=1172188 RepID=UPI0012DECC11|nr:hypothetical protein [Terracoccus sp. 273MFTsu3.1]
MSPAALWALALTLAVEVPVLVAFARAAGWTGWGRALVGAVGVNVVTHPVLYAVSTGFGSPWQLVGAEVAVAAVETALLVAGWRVRSREDAVTVALTVVAANAASTALGLLVL